MGVGFFRYKLPDEKLVFRSLATTSTNLNEPLKINKAIFSKDYYLYLAN